MPTYQYRCAECGQDLEVVQKFTDSALTECPNCQGQLRKVYNAVGVVFKGSGFYSTDSRKGSSTNGAGKSGSSTNSSGSNDSGSNGSAEKKSSGSTSSESGSSTPAKATATASAD